MDPLLKLPAHWKHAALVVTLVLGLSSCGPVVYMSTVTRGASSAVEAAKSARADKYAPYYYTLAVEYLTQARKEAARSDFQAANNFGKKSKEAAEKAREKALAVARQGGDVAGVKDSGIAPLATPSSNATVPRAGEKTKSDSAVKKGGVE